MSFNRKNLHIREKNFGEFCVPDEDGGPKDNDNHILKIANFR